MLLILAHGACMGRCLGEESSAKPPCHDQEETPEHESNLCSEGPALEAKTSPVLKCTMDGVDLPRAVPIPALTHAWQSDSALFFETVSPPPLQLTVLRI